MGRKFLFVLICISQFVRGYIDFKVNPKLPVASKSNNINPEYINKANMATNLDSFVEKSSTNDTITVPESINSTIHKLQILDINSFGSESLNLENKPEWSLSSTNADHDINIINSAKASEQDINTTDNTETNGLPKEDNPSDLVHLDNTTRSRATRKRRKLKNWHDRITTKVRNDLVVKILAAQYPEFDIQNFLDNQIGYNWLVCATDIENCAFTAANSKSEYFKQLDVYIFPKEKCRKRQQDDEAGSTNPKQPRRPPISRGQITPIVMLIKKDWQEYLLENTRIQVIKRLVSTYMLLPNSKGEWTDAVEFIMWIRKIEARIFRDSDSLLEYNEVVIEKISKAQDEIEWTISTNMKMGFQLLNAEAQIRSNTNDPTFTNSETINLDYLQALPATLNENVTQMITSQVRDQMVFKLLQTMFPNKQIQAYLDPRILDILQYVRETEKCQYENASSRSDYYRRLGEKIYELYWVLKNRKIDKRTAMSNE